MNKYIAGWMTPEGEFFECELYDHIKTVADTPELSRFVPDMDAYIDRLASIDDDCSELAADGEHPGWHSYDMASWDVGDKIRDLLLKGGCMRVGTIPKEGTMHFESRASLITATKLQAAKDLAENYGYTPVFEDV